MADEQEEFGVKFAATAETVTEAKQAFAHLTEQMAETAKTGETLATTTKTVDDAAGELRKQIADLEEVLRKQATALANNELPLDVFLEGNKAARTVIGQLESALDSITPKLDAAVGEGSDEDGTSGFKGIAGAAVKANKAIGILASGGGLGRLPSMLEGVTSALGLAGGVGMAAGGLILALESTIPKIVTFIEKMDGAAEAARRTAEQIKQAEDQMTKFMGQPTEEEATGAKAVKGLLAGRGGTLVAQGIEQVLRQQGVGLMTPEMRALSETFVGPETTAADERKQQDEAVAIRRSKIMEDLKAGRMGAISEVSGMAGQFPGLFPAGTEQHFRQALPENIEAAKKQARDAEEGSRQADAQYARQAAASKENLGIQDEFDKALKDKRKHAATEYDAAMKFAADWKAELDNKAIAAEKHAATKAEHDAKAAKTKAERDAKAAKTAADKFDREHTPEALTSAEAKGQRSEEMGMARDVQAARVDAGDTIAAHMGPQELQQVVAHVGKNRMMNSTLGFTLAEQVNFYMLQLEAKMVADFTSGMGQHDRSGQLINPRGGH